MRLCYLLLALRNELDDKNRSDVNELIIAEPGALLAAAIKNRTSTPVLRTAYSVATSETVDAIASM